MNLRESMVVHHAKLYSALRHDPYLLLLHTGLMSPVFRFFSRRNQRYLDKVGAARFAEKSIAGLQLREHDFSKSFDLGNLHKLLRKRRPKVVLEFGCGNSTLIMAHALMMNNMEVKRAYPHLGDKLKGKLHVIEASKSWADLVKKDIPEELVPYIEIETPELEVIEVDFQVCHRFKKLPDIVPEFIYLDGPNPLDCPGDYLGLSFENGRTVMAADPLYYEATLNPGFFMVVDGRVNNVQFLRNNFKRKYRYKWHRLSQLSTFELLDKSDFKSR